VNVQYKPMRKNETNRFVPDIKKIQSNVKIKFTDIESGIKRTIEWYSKNT
jgi:dTDP-D-glucose 4,6-dehydratase